MGHAADKQNQINLPLLFGIYDKVRRRVGVKAEGGSVMIINIEKLMRLERREMKGKKKHALQIC